MLNFRKPEIKDREWINNCINEGETDGCCYSFGNLIAWGDSYFLEIAEFEGMCLMRSNSPKGTSYAFPAGKGDIKKAMLAIMDEARENGQLFRMHHVLEQNIATLNELFPGMFDFRFNRHLSEYVYSVKNMAELPGKKFHGKKGHVNAFFRKHTDVYCDPVTEDNVHICLEIADSWRSDRDDEAGELQSEYNALEKSVRHFKALGLMGAILYADGKPVAFTLGEPIKNNTFCTHYEKTIPEYRDAFPVINNGFTKLMLLSYDYVNREEDTGSEGLRKAKLSYYPEFLLNKYTASLKNDPARKYSAEESDYPELKALWKTVFGDSDAVLDAFFENTVKSENIYAFRKDGKIVSAFYLIDSTLIENNKTFSAKYLYAAATLPEYRKQGIMSEMIKYAADILKIKGTDILFLYPADEKLYEYYGNLGFVSQFRERFYKIEKTEIEKYKGNRYFNTALSYEKMRDNIPSESYIKFDSAYLDFSRFCAVRYGFEICAVFDDEDKVFVIGNKKDGHVVIDEAVSADGNYEHILSVIADIECDSYILKTPVCIELAGFNDEIKKSGMMLTLSDNVPEDENIYLGQPCM
ncbi:MAG: GNAT family N-acetyltransferase [Clostridia bacterium]|nr:GNAT family N-acetyltransferase [Clostridia bacterium]